MQIHPNPRTHVVLNFIRNVFGYTHIHMCMSEALDIVEMNEEFPKEKLHHDIQHTLIGDIVYTLVKCMDDILYIHV